MFTPDGERLIGGHCFSGDELPVGHLWDARTGREVGTIGNHDGGYVTNVAISPDERRVATVGGTDKTGIVWDVETGRRVATLVGHSGDVESVEFSPDGRLVATGSHDGTARLWDAKTGQEVLVLSGTRASIGEVTFSPDRRLLATGGYDGFARIWDITPEGSREALTLSVSGEFSKVAYSRDGSMLVAADEQGIHMWDAGNGKALEHIGWGNSNVSEFVPDVERRSRHRGLAGRAGSWLRGAPRHVSRGRECSARLGPLGATESIRRRRRRPRPRRPLRGVFRPTHRDAGCNRTERQETVEDVAFTPDGAVLVSTSWDGTAKMWDVGTHEQIGTLRGHEDKVGASTSATTVPLSSPVAPTARHGSGPGGSPTQSVAWARGEDQ